MTPQAQMSVFNSFGVVVVSKIKNGCTKQCIINAFENMKKSKKQQRVSQRLKREQEVQEWITKKIEEFSGFISRRMLSQLAKKEGLEHCSPSFFNSKLHKHLSCQNINFKPSLTKQHLKARVSFDQMTLHFVRAPIEALKHNNDKRTMLMHCDTKWFNALSHSMKVNVPKGQPSPRDAVTIKSLIPNVMLFCWCWPPNP